MESVIEPYQLRPLSVSEISYLYMFDLDDTILFQCEKDNKIYYKTPINVINRIKSISQFPIAIFTNQLGLSNNKVTLSEILERVTRFISDINSTELTMEDILSVISNNTYNNSTLSTSLILPYVFIAPKDDKFRKPLCGMYQHFLKKYLGCHTRDLKNVFVQYCGDAAGRINDFADTDRKFAINIKANFVTPEVFFDNLSAHDVTEKYTLKGFSPDDFLVQYKMYNKLFLMQKPLEMIIMVGPPSSGKSTFAKAQFSAYTYINMDTLGNTPKCIRMATAAIKSKLSLVIDNTNPSAEVRKRYLSLLVGTNYTCKCIYMNVDIDLAKHLNKYRLQYTGKNIPQIAYGKYQSQFEYPKLSEGFSEIIVANFIPDFTQKQLKKFKYRY
jgi:DNA 3'-phosphatase